MYNLKKTKKAAYLLGGMLPFNMLCCQEAISAVKSGYRCREYPTNCPFKERSSCYCCTLPAQQNRHKYNTTTFHFAQLFLISTAKIYGFILTSKHFDRKFYYKLQFYHNVSIYVLKCYCFIISSRNVSSLISSVDKELIA